jgi:hypothetical protein
MRKITSLLVCAVAVLAIAAGPAYAQTATEDGYAGLGGALQGQGGGGGPVATSGGTGGDGGSLPFTGLELGLIAAMGAGLVGVGFAVRRASRPREITP